MAIERIQIVISQRGARLIRHEFLRLGNAAQLASKQVGLMKAALLGLISGSVLASLTRMSDEMTNLSNRMKLVTDSQGQLNAVMGEMQRIADDTRTSIAATGQLYTRFALGARQLGKSQQDILDLVESVNQAVILSGANAREAEAALLQFSQGFASDRLAGDEIRAVLEQLPLIADILGKELGVSRGAIRQLASEGKITAEQILEAFKEAAPELAAQFQRTIPTVAQSFIVLKNNITASVRELNGSLGIFDKLALFIRDVLAPNVEFLGRVAFAGALTLGVIAATKAVVGLTIALATNPFGALAIAVTAAASILVAFSDKISVSEDGVVKLSDVITALGQIILEDLKPAIREVTEFIENDFLGKLVETPKTIGDIVADTFATVLSGLVGISGGLLYALSGLIGSLWNLIIDFIDDIFNVVVALIKSLFYELDYFFGSVGEAIRATEAAFNAAFELDFTLAGEYLADARRAITTAVTGIGRGAREAFEEEAQIDRLDFLKLDVGGDNPLDAIVNSFNEGFKKFQSESAPLFRLLAKSWVGELDLIGGEALDEFFKRVTDRARQIAAQRQVKNLIQGTGRVLDSFLESIFGSKLNRRIPGDDNLKNLREVNLERYVKELEGEADALRLSSREREIHNEFIKIEQDLLSKNVTLKPLERAFFVNQIRTNQALSEGQAAVEAYADALPLTARGAQLFDAAQKNMQASVQILLEQLQEGSITLQEYNLGLDRLVRGFDLQATIMRQVLDPMETYKETMQAIAEVAKAASNDIERANIELAKTQARIALLEGSRDMFSGFERGFLTLQENFTDIGRLAEDTLVNAFSSAEQSLLNFITTGKAGFRELFQSIGQDLVLLGIRQFITGPLANLLGQQFGGGNLLGAFGFGPRAGGGSMMSGGDYVVGELGPEIVRMNPGGGAQVLSNQKSRQVLQGQNSNVSVNIYVTAQDADSFRRTGDQITSELARRIRRKG